MLENYDATIYSAAMYGTTTTTIAIVYKGQLQQGRTTVENDGARKLLAWKRRMGIPPLRTWRSGTTGGGARLRRMRCCS